MQKLKCKMQNGGFTLIEVILVAAILLVVGTISVNTFSRLNKNVAIQKDAEKIASLVREAESNTLASKNGSQYGVHFEVGKAVLFVGDTYASNSSTNEIVALEPFISLSSISLGGSGGGGSSSSDIFNPAVQYMTGVGTTGIAACDLDGDGYLDIITTSYSSSDPSGTPGKVSVLYGNSGGTFGSRIDYATPPYPYAVACGDINNDGKLDLVLTAHKVYGANITVVLTNNGWRSFSSDPNYTTNGAFDYMDGGTGFYEVALADLNNDGKIDIAVHNLNYGRVDVFKQNADGTFGVSGYHPTGSPSYYPTGSPFLYSNIVLSDLNNDGRPDIIVTGYPTYSDTQTYGKTVVSVLMNNGDGTFKPKVDYHVDYLSGVAAGDLNGDGRKDLVVSSFDSKTVSVLMNNGDSNATLTLGSSYNLASRPDRVILADVNQDNKLDIVALSEDGAGSVSILLGNGDGTFASPAVVYPTGMPAMRIVAGDFNGDHKVDLAVIYRAIQMSDGIQYNGKVSVLTNKFIGPVGGSGSGGSNDVVFKKLTGETDHFGYITLSTVGSPSVSRQINISATGVVGIQ